MGYHPRIEIPGTGSFLTTRCRNSELWFARNPNLEKAILGYAAKYQDRYSVDLYAIAIEGSHIHHSAQFSNGHRSDYMRDFNSSVARAVPRYTSNYPGGRLWGRRFSSEIVPEGEDIEENFFYTVLQPVQDGLVERISDYPFYNCFHDAVWGISRKYELVDWTAYNEARRWHKFVDIIDFIKAYPLTFKRLPGYEQLPQKEYAEIMHHKLEERRKVVVDRRYTEGKGFAGREALYRVKRGSTPRHTKTSTRFSHRPRVLCKCPKRRKYYADWYFEIFFDYKYASKEYRGGNLDVNFPEGTAKPYLRAPPNNAK